MCELAVYLQLFCSYCDVHSADMVIAQMTCAISFVVYASTQSISSRCALATSEIRWITLASQHSVQQWSSLCRYRSSFRSSWVVWFHVLPHCTPSRPPPLTGGTTSGRPYDMLQLPCASITAVGYVLIATSLRRSGVRARAVFRNVYRGGLACMRPPHRCLQTRKAPRGAA